MGFPSQVYTHQEVGFLGRIVACTYLLRFVRRKGRPQQCLFPGQRCCSVPQKKSRPCIGLPLARCLAACSRISHGPGRMQFSSITYYLMIVQIYFIYSTTN